MLIPGRTGNSPAYKYGFNGKEKDDQLKGEGNSYDFGARMYDPRVGRWFAQDSKRNMYPGHTPYNYALNSPMFLKDPNGKWVVKIDKNAEGKYSLTFVAEKGDNLKTLAIQLGIPKESLIKDEPSLKSLKILTNTEIKLSNISQVKNINEGINYIADRPTTTNCSNLADRCDGGGNDVKNTVWGNNVDDFEKILGNDPSVKKDLNFSVSQEVDSYISVTEKESRIGDVIMYKLDPKSEQAIIDSGTSPLEAKDIMNGERHYSIIVLKDKKGEKPQNILQKNGTIPFDFNVDEATDLSLPTNSNIKYQPSTPKGSTSPINRRVENKKNP